MSLLRILRTAQQTLTHQFQVDEQLTDASGAVTATVKRLDGTQIVGSPFTAAHPGLGTYTFALPGQPLVDTLTVDWSGTVAGATLTQTDTVEIVGGYLFGLAEARAAHESLSSMGTYPSSLLAAKRIQVEQECERICSRAFVPRFGRLTVDGTGFRDLTIPDLDVRSIRAASIQQSPGGAFVALTAGELTLLTVSPAGIVHRIGAIWPWGHRNILLEYEYGMDYPPADVSGAAIMRLRSLVTQTSSGIPDRALSYSVAEGGVYRLATPGPRATGIPEVDAAYGRYAFDSMGFA